MLHSNVKLLKISTLFLKTPRMCDQVHDVETVYRLLSANFDHLEPFSEI